MTFLAQLSLTAGALLLSAAASAQVSSSSSGRGTPTNVPEPSSLPLVVIGLVGAVAVVRFINRKK